MSTTRGLDERNVDHSAWRRETAPGGSRHHPDGIVAGLFHAYEKACDEIDDLRVKLMAEIEGREIRASRPKPEDVWDRYDAEVLSLDFEYEGYTLAAVKLPKDARVGRFLQVRVPPSFGPPQGES